MDKAKVVRAGLLYVVWVVLIYLAVLGAEHENGWVMLFGAVSGVCLAIYILLTVKTDPVVLDQTCLRPAREDSAKPRR